MKKKKFDSGGVIPSEDLELLRKAFKRFKQPPGRYDSIRPEGFEQDIKDEKSNAVNLGLRGAGKVATNAALAIPAAGMLTDTDEMARGAKMMRGALNKYQNASERQDAADREMDAQLRRETRGVEYKKGGSVSSASKRADGCAQRGKTRGMIVACGGGYMKGKK